jgi:hypothetical protein
MTLPDLLRGTIELPDQEVQENVTSTRRGILLILDNHFVYTTHE